MSVRRRRHPLIRGRLFEDEDTHLFADAHRFSQKKVGVCNLSLSRLFMTSNLGHRWQNPFSFVEIVIHGHPPHFGHSAGKKWVSAMGVILWSSICCADFRRCPQHPRRHSHMACSLELAPPERSDAIRPLRTPWRPALPPMNPSTAGVLGQAYLRRYSHSW